MTRVRNEDKRNSGDILDTNWEIDEDSKISNDGKQLLVRLPRKVVEVMNIEKGDKINFHIDIAKPNQDIKKSVLKITYKRKST